MTLERAKCSHCGRHFCGRVVHPKACCLGYWDDRSNERFVRREAGTGRWIWSCDKRCHLHRLPTFLGREMSIAMLGPRHVEVWDFDNDVIVLQEVDEESAPDFAVREARRALWRALIDRWIERLLFK